MGRTKDRETGDGHSNFPLNKGEGALEVRGQKRKKRGLGCSSAFLLAVTGY